MRTRVAEMLGVEFPICAFSHCRDVVAAVTNAGGFGILGATAHSPGRLRSELTWIEEQTGGKPFVDDLLARYGVTAPAGDARPSFGGLNISPKSYEPLLDVAFAHNIRLIASALGPPPADLVERAHDDDVLVAAL